MIPTRDESATSPRLDGPQRALAGDETMLDLASRIARGFGRRHPSLYEEFASAAHYGLCLAALKTTHAGSPDSFRSFACDHMHTQCLKAIEDERPRGRRRSRTRVVREDLDSVAEPAARPSDADADRRFAELIEPLGDEERRVLALVYRDNYGQLEVASMLGCSDRRVWQIHDTALAKLRGDHERRLRAGRSLMDARLARGLSRGELARRLRKSLSYVKKVEAGQLVPLEADARRIAEIVGSRPG